MQTIVLLIFIYKPQSYCIAYGNDKVNPHTIYNISLWQKLDFHCHKARSFFIYVKEKEIMIEEFHCQNFNSTVTLYFIENSYIFLLGLFWNAIWEFYPLMRGIIKINNLNIRSKQFWTKTKKKILNKFYQKKTLRDLNHLFINNSFA